MSNVHVGALRMSASLQRMTWRCSAVSVWYVQLHNSAQCHSKACLHDCIAVYHKAAHSPSSCSTTVANGWVVSFGLKKHVSIFCPSCKRNGRHHLMSQAQLSMCNLTQLNLSAYPRLQAALSSARLGHTHSVRMSCCAQPSYCHLFCWPDSAVGNCQSHLQFVPFAQHCSIQLIMV